MATFLVCHGAWSGGWSWGRLRAPLRAAGHELLTPTYTGLGERSHLANPTIDLETHVRDVLNVLEYEDLRDIALIGHSYGGMVATVVADRATDRLSRLVYIDGFVPTDGACLFDYHPPQVRTRMRELAKAEGDGWRIPPGPLAPDVTSEDAVWIEPRRVPHPLMTFEEHVTLAGNASELPHAYIYCLKKGPEDAFAAVSAGIKTSPDWRYEEIDSGHVPNITAPRALAGMLDRIVAGGG